MYKLKSYSIFILSLILISLPCILDQNSRYELYGKCWYALKSNRAQVEVTGHDVAKGGLLVVAQKRRGSGQTALAKNKD